ncbi:serine hydrolase domain-containing protein [Brevibacillus fluminis]|uniref:serine hydrolase domain-containing protein n=1 Tax=Brevibacillus fluminis TaxID=511487 RepID=UPI003F895750
MFDSIDRLRLEQELKKVKICSCLIYHDDHLIFGHYRNKKMATKLFPLHSATKSVLSILIGIAIENGEIESVHTPIADYFPNLDAGKRAITIEHLLTMTPGFDWPEWGDWGGRPFPMINSRDWVSFVLDREMTGEPGAAMRYNSGASHLLSAILQKATKQKASAYAQKVLFAPLGIEEHRWYEDAKGICIGGFGLCLRAADLGKIGSLMMHGGTWGNKRILSEAWASVSTAAIHHTYDHVGSYGYHWWVLVDENRQAYDPTFFMAMGYGGQYIIVSPAHKLVVVFTSELFQDTFLPLRLFRTVFLPNGSGVLAAEPGER